MAEHRTQQPENRSVSAASATTLVARGDEAGEIRRKAREADRRLQKDRERELRKAEKTRQRRREIVMFLLLLLIVIGFFVVDALIRKKPAAEPPRTESAAVMAAAPEWRNLR